MLLKKIRSAWKENEMEREKGCGGRLGDTGGAEERETQMNCDKQSYVKRKEKWNTTATCL